MYIQKQQNIEHVLTFQKPVVVKSSSSSGPTSAQESGIVADLGPSDSNDATVTQLVHIIADVLHILKQVYQNEVGRGQIVEIIDMSIY